MAPYFLRNLVPRREKTVAGRSLVTVLGTLTWVQWAHFFSGYVVDGLALGVVTNEDLFAQLASLELRRNRLLLRLLDCEPYSPIGSSNTTDLLQGYPLGGAVWQGYE